MKLQIRMFSTNHWTYTETKLSPLFFLPFCWCRLCFLQTAEPNQFFVNELVRDSKNIISISKAVQKLMWYCIGNCMRAHPGILKSINFCKNGPIEWSEHCQFDGQQLYNYDLNSKINYFGFTLQNKLFFYHSFFPSEKKSPDCQPPLYGTLKLTWRKNP